MKMDKGVQITLIIAIAVVVLVVLSISYLNAPYDDYKDTLNIDGSATVSANPDLITVYFTVETNASDAVTAKDENSRIVDELISNLVSAGFDKKNITTENFNVYEDYSWGKDGTRKLLGYKVNHNVKLVLDSSMYEMVGDAVDAGINAGALVNYISFELSDKLRNSLKADALKLASEDARNKADAVAEGLGKRIGDIVSVSANDFNYRPWLAYESSPAKSVSDNGAEAMVIAGGTDIVPSSRDVSAQVSVTFKLK